MALSLTHCVNRRCCQLSLKRCSLSCKEDLILPGRVRACPEIFARILREEGYAASVVQRWTVTKGPGKDRTGGVAFRLSGVCQAPSRAEASSVLPSSEGVHEGKRHGYFLRPAG
jgi:hypothetical protein